jgi:transcriptional regulator with XRE-family HTH domain
LRAGLTQDQVAQRLGLKGKNRGGYVSHLEHGREPNPSLGTVVRFVHACGARLSELAEQLDRVEPVPMDESLARTVSQAWPAGSSPPGRKPSVSAETAKERVVAKAEDDTQKFQRHAARPLKGAPPTEEKLRSGTAKLREFHVQLNIVKEDITSYLLEVKRGLAERVWFTRLGSKLLGALRRFSGPARQAKLEEITAWARRIGLRPQLVSDVRRIVETRWLVSFAPAGTPRAQDRAFRQTELELKTAFQRRELFAQTARLVIPRLASEERNKSDDYCRLALEFYRVWIQAMLEPAGVREQHRDQEFDAREEQAKQQGLKPELVKAVRQLSASILTD